MPGTCSLGWKLIPGERSTSSQQAIEKFVRAEGWKVTGPLTSVPAEVAIWTKTTEQTFTVGERSIALPDPLPAGWELQLRAFLQEYDPERPVVRRLSVPRSRGNVPSQLSTQPPRPSAHAFISYSTHDQAYVDKLVTHLRSSGVTAWIDKSGIDYGTRWKSVVRTAVDSCGACVVVMTPEAENSEWVDREISRAEDKQKPILPLLVRGTPFFALGDLQYEDLTGGKMPSGRWLMQLRKKLDSR